MKEKTRKWKRNSIIVTKISVFCILFALLYFCVFNVLAVRDADTEAMMGGFYDERPDSLDVICIGSSATYAYFNAPMAFHEYGFTTYNFCSGGQPFLATKFLIEESRKTQNPKVYIINLRSLVNNTGNLIDIRRVTTNMPWTMNRLATAGNCQNFYQILL